ncbi:MAG: tetratricopeptide repeat protein, partial [Myxococcota bacterium]
VVASSSAPVTRPCDTGSITELWNPSARDAVEVALLQTGVPYAATTSATVRRVLDRYADAWGQQHQALCEAGREGTEDARMLDLRRLCLLRHRAAVAEYIAVLRGADAGVAAKAAVAASRLPAMSRCVSPGDLIAPPDDPVAAAVVARVLEDLGRAKVLREGGRYDAARNVVAAAEIQADAAAHGPTQARVMFEAGAVAHARGEYSEAAETLERATLTAVASGYDAVEADAATLLTTVVGWRLAEPDAGARWGRQAEAALERLGDDPRRRGNLRSALGFMARAAGDRDAALAHFRAAVAARTSVFGPTSVVVGAARGNLGGTLITAGELAAAEAELRASTEILEAALGDAHPIVGAALQGLGAVQRHQGKLGDALATTNRTVAISERTLGADHPDLAVGLASRALVQMERERYPEAIADFRRALHIRERVLGPEHADVGLVLNNLGVALRRAQDYHGALPVAERALRLWEATLGEAHPRVASANNNVGYVLAELGRWDEAEPHYRRAAALWDEAAGSHDDDVADALVGLGRALNEQARPVPALAALRRSASLMGDSLASNDDRRAQLELELGRALAATGEDPERALRLVTAARATLAAKPERNRPHIERADRWLRGERPSDAAPELAQPPTHLPSR